MQGVPIHRRRSLRLATRKRKDSLVDRVVIAFAGAAGKPGSVPVRKNSSASRIRPWFLNARMYHQAPES